MRTRDMVRRAINAPDYIRRAPRHDEYGELVREDTIIRVDGRPVVLYMRLDEALLRPLRQIALASRMTTGVRTEGLPQRSCVYGAMPRHALRNNYCRMTAETLRRRGWFGVIQSFASTLTDIYREHLPEACEINMRVVADNVRPAYVMPETPFTTVNFNVNHAIPYHTDTGNFPGVFSNVLILRDGVVGGHLVLPEFGIAFAQDDRALILFDGQGIMHGVTPIRQTAPHGYRCSTVFYALEKMKLCYDLDAEIDEGRRRRSVMERRWADPAHVAKQRIATAKEAADDREKRKGRH